MPVNLPAVRREHLESYLVSLQEAGKTTEERYPRSMRLPRVPALNATFGTQGDKVLLLDAIPVEPGECFTLSMPHSNSPWRQGVFLATDGVLEVAGVASPSVVLWRDSAPATSRLCVRTTDGVLRIYNVWDSGRGLATFESQSATSGMVRADRGDGVIEYRCNDIGLPARFDKLTIELAFSTAKPPITLQAL